ncbi:wings apart-like protein 1 isoform X2 [Malania oleifera]|uniref:wings apart-like protein 1 isoform X2 n=1 Tax=Malania oleifera TaxID=397392 RepID=UPI0025AE8D68|nr:wings apart-like protein 1 isoform X2 [Malania oleifera]
MIVRTYGRRNRGISRSYSDSAFDNDVEPGFEDPLSQELESPQEIYSLAFSSQDSSRWSLDSEPCGSSEGSLLPLGDLAPGGPRKAKKARIGRREGVGGGNSCRPPPFRVERTESIAATATLMETQEFGEMMEHVDEVNFALDGLRKNRQVRIRRASLLSLLSIAATAQQRRLLRTQGMAKTIIDAILGLNLDDLPCNLAAAALFYVLTSDGQDDNLLESPSCIHFLLKLLKPIVSDSSKDKAPSIGCKLLALRKDADALQDTSKGLDSSSDTIALKVQEILVSCKELKSTDGSGNGVGRPELSPKWIALLTMEKASLSTISLEDASGTIRKSGSNFKEKLRELGGLDAIFDIVLNCHSAMEDIKQDADTQSLVLLLKCLKIMENATFLSKDNQSHLLEMKRNLDGHRFPVSFIQLIISVIKILSGLSLNRCSVISTHEKSHAPSNGTGPTGSTFDKALMADCRENSSENFAKCFSLEKTSAEKSFNICQNSNWLSTVRSANSASSSEATTTSADTSLLKMRLNSSTSGSCSVASRSSNSERWVKNSGSRKNMVLGKRPIFSEETKTVPSEDAQDPFAFDEDDFEPSKWDLLSGNKKKASQMQENRVTCRELEDGFQSQLMMSQQDSNNGENHHSHGISCSDFVKEENLNLLAECLLTAVKVLMNLTNDNPVGCQQIAGCGGLETMSLLIACHFPSFSSSLPSFTETLENNLSQSSIELDDQSDTHFTDQQLDFLVAILGLLVNLVEKDSCNRSRLAEASVLLPNTEGFNKEIRRDVIPLLCSIFLANRGAGEAAGEGNPLPWDDEAAVLQGEREAEKMIIEAYSALLLAFLSTESKSTRNVISNCLPEHNIAILVPVLERFVAFHLTLNMISPETHIAVSEVIESCRVP